MTKARDSFQKHNSKKFAFLNNSALKEFPSKEPFGRGFSRKALLRSARKVNPREKASQNTRNSHSKKAVKSANTLNGAPTKRITNSNETLPSQSFSGEAFPKSFSDGERMFPNI
ncbi:hypothetical protein [Thermococcus sp. 21S9]|uniref:hypothetical protein n=1 Tax=Thermococcus sp. 21S9 TaxID=1638223 RepID=UPI00143C8705|nr:hypothetical protein [Thermococcus sp. 21S9]